MWFSSPFPRIHPEKHGVQSALSRGMFPVHGNIDRSSALLMTFVRV